MPEDEAQLHKMLSNRLNAALLCYVRFVYTRLWLVRLNARSRLVQCLL